MKEGRSIDVVIAAGDQSVTEHIRHCAQGHQGVRIAAVCRSSAEVQSYMHARRADVLILDTVLPETGCFSLLHALGSKDRPMVIFTAASEEHALIAFQFHPLDYLLYPLDAALLARAFERALEQTRSASARGLPAGLPGQPGLQKSPRKRLMVKTGGKIVFLTPEEIDWVEADRDYVRIHNGGRKYHMRGTITGMEQQLPDERFVRIHRSTIVNVDRIREMQPLSYGEYAVILLDGTRLTLSRSFRERVFRRLVTAA